MTLKIAEKQLSRIWFHWYRLQDALNKAHSDELIKYSQWTDGPCSSMQELREKIDATTKFKIADLFQKEVRRKVSPW